MGKKDKVKVAAIQIQYPDGDVKQLSLDDAKELFEQLEGLFGSKTTYLPSQPVIIERERYPWRPMWHSSTGTTEQLKIDTPVETPKVWCCSEPQA